MSLWKRWAVGRQLYPHDVSMARQRSWTGAGMVFSWRQPILKRWHLLWIKWRPYANAFRQTFSGNVPETSATPRAPLVIWRCLRRLHRIVPGRRNMRRPDPFGLKLSMENAREIARAAIYGPPTNSVALVVTPNIDHIAMLRRSPALTEAYRNAARIVCDGWPVQAYARWCGIPIERVTGCEITEELMRLARYSSVHNLFFVVDSETTAQTLRAWAARNGINVELAIPPFGFELDTGFCQGLASSIRNHRTTILIMAVGAPRSEIFVDTHRTSLPPCWAFCVGQAVKIELGLVQRASTRWQAARMEWFWRLCQEPSRLLKRYSTAAFGFGIAVIEDQLRTRCEKRS